jgi:hypothetical protein
MFVATPRPWTNTRSDRGTINAGSTYSSENRGTKTMYGLARCHSLSVTQVPDPTQVEVPLAVFEFIEGWDNPHRRHSALDYESPISYQL